MTSSLEQAVSAHREAILERWLARIVDDYPAETGRLLRSKRDRFTNPVGHALNASVGPLLDAAVRGEVGEEALAALDAILRVRAVQELGPGEAVGFLLRLREVVRGELQGAPTGTGPDALSELDRGVDALTLAGFEVYVRCREEVWRIRNDEIRRRSTKVLERLDLWRAIRDGDDSGQR